jgi:hypothetical protein
VAIFCFDYYCGRNSLKMKLESLSYRDRFDILLEKRLSGVVGLKYISLYGKSQLTQFVVRFETSCFKSLRRKYTDEYVLPFEKKYIDFVQSEAAAIFLDRF